MEYDYGIWGLVIFNSLFFGLCSPSPISTVTSGLHCLLFMGKGLALVICQIGNLMMMGGLTLVAMGWIKIYRSRDALVTSGIYSYLRHPQYTGLLLFTIGLLIQWPTLVGLLMFPILCLIYVRLAKAEEGDVEKEFGEAYTVFKNSTPAFIPFIKRPILKSANGM
jgi:protein-S-isoprenylcysteine O-methyltransferase Ste14